MLSNHDFARQSLELHLFFARIMKEHSLFLEMGFTPKDYCYTQQADNFRQEFDQLLWEVVRLSYGVVTPEVLNSGEVFTRYTLDAELATSFYTGIKIPSEITKAEIGMEGGDECYDDHRDMQKIHAINQKAIHLISDLIKFKANVLENVLCCKMFTVNYPLLIDHIMREAKLYLYLVKKIQSRERFDIQKEILEQEIFWNTIMAEHSKFIRGLLDPTEESLIQMANNFANNFDQLTAEAKVVMDKCAPVVNVTVESMRATEEIRKFKAQGTQGILECKIKSTIVPLLADHTLREANHYLRLLKIFM